MSVENAYLVHCGAKVYGIYPECYIAVDEAKKYAANNPSLTFDVYVLSSTHKAEVRIISNYAYTGNP